MSNKSADNYSNLLHSDATEHAKEGPSKFDKMLSAIAGVADFTTGFVAEQVHEAGQDVVSRVLLGESYSRPEHGLQPEKQPEREVERDDGMDR